MKKTQVFFRFNEKGYKEEVHWYDDNENISSKDFFTYDSAHNIVLMERIGSDQVLKMKSTTKYNDQGQILEHIIYGQDSSKIKTHNYKYNSKGYKKEMVYIIHYSSGDDYSKWKYEYDYKQTSMNDKNGNELEWIRYENDGTLDFRIDKQYDKYGNETKYHMYDGSTTYGNERYEYIYDSKNNWIEKQYYRGGNKTEVEIRDIIYY